MKLNMKLLLINLLLFLVPCIIGDENIKWNEAETSRTIKPDIRRFVPQTTNYVVRPNHFHYKTHFGIIIRQNTTFSLQVDAEGTIEQLFFHCLTSSGKETYIELNLSGQNSSEIIQTTPADCVPMTSVSHNILVSITIKTENWLELPVFDTKDVTFLTSQEAEEEFFQNVETYGFCENYYTQMLLSSEDIRILKSKNYSLYLGLKNQADLVQYYDYLLGASRFANENENLGYALMERTSMFLRTEPCISNVEIDPKGRLVSEEPERIYDRCEDVKESCYAYSGCGYYAYYGTHWIAIISDSSELLSPFKGAEWVLLHEVGHNYNVGPYNTDLAGIGFTGEVWNNIYAALYQQKFSVKVYWINESAKEVNDTIVGYQKRQPLTSWGWRSRLHFFMSIFGFDGTDSALREFHLRHYQHSERTHQYFNNIIPTILEVFLDLYNINLLPYLRNIVDFEEQAVPLFTEDLELRLLSGHAVLPSLDFSLGTSDLQIRSKERDFRHVNPLVLLPKVPRKQVSVTFNIKSKKLLFGRCLYLNNECYKIFGRRMKLRLWADVYSSYVAAKVGKRLFISEVAYHTISENMAADIVVKEIGKDDTYLPLVHYTITAFATGDVLLAQAFINYKNREISISEWDVTEPNDYMTLKRDGKTVLHQLLGTTSKPVINMRSKFEVGDFLALKSAEGRRFEINGKSVDFRNSSTVALLFTPVGIHNVDNFANYEIVQDDVVRIDGFMKEHNIDLGGNVLYQQHLNRYAHKLQKFRSDIEFPKSWLEF